MVLVWIVLLLTLPLDRCPKDAKLIVKILVSAGNVLERKNRSGGVYTQ